jgi:hypothetical protein
VSAEVQRLCGALFEGAAAPEIARAFVDAETMYRGAHPDYHPCDTAYHDLQHVLDVTLAMARLMDGYERSRVEGEPLTRDLFVVGVITALFHDFGYLRKRGDRTRRHGAEYTLTHVSRGSEFLRRYLRLIGLAHMAATAATLVHFTGYERSPEAIRVSDALLRRIGQMLGSADLIAQMSDRCYLEKCRDRLYYEFLIGRTVQRAGVSRALPFFSSGQDLLQKTPDFFKVAETRLELQLAGAYRYAARHFGGQNLYLDEALKNVRYAELIARAPATELLRRQPPNTLARAQPELAQKDLFELDVSGPAAAGNTPSDPSSAR